MSLLSFGDSIPFGDILRELTRPLVGTAVTTYTYDAANRLRAAHTGSGVISYTWDARGNLIGDGAFTYAYNAAGRLVRAQSVTATVVYTYTADGLRVAQSVDGVVTAFAWDWASSIPEMLSDGGALYLVGLETVGHARGGEWAYYLSDALGSVRQVADGAGGVTVSREWTPYGEEVGGWRAGLGYTGEWQDGVLGLVYLRARWYAPGVGRFLQKDPWEGDLSLPPSLHPYLYAYDNPANYLDPTGTQPMEWLRSQAEACYKAGDLQCVWGMVQNRLTLLWVATPTSGIATSKSTARGSFYAEIGLFRPQKENRVDANKL